MCRRTRPHPSIPVVASDGRSRTGSAIARGETATLLCDARWSALSSRPVTRSSAAFHTNLSGGQQQRVMIAMAIVGDPPLIVLDEPTTGLDVVTQARLLSEILRLRDEMGSTIVYVTHDIAAIATVADVIAVMYAGRVVEQGPVEQILRHPVHPYTVGLMESVPDLSGALGLKGLSGAALGVGEWPTGCPFAPRCPQRVEICEAKMPIAERSVPDHVVRCFEWRKTPELVRDRSTSRARKRWRRQRPVGRWTIGNPSRPGRGGDCSQGRLVHRRRWRVRCTRGRIRQRQDHESRAAWRGYTGQQRGPFSFTDDRSRRRHASVTEMLDADCRSYFKTPTSLSIHANE